MKRVRAWAVTRVGGEPRERRLIFAMSPECEEGVEVFRTRRLARGAAFRDEKVIPVVIEYDERAK